MVSGPGPMVVCANAIRCAARSMRASTSHRGKFGDVAIIFGRLDLCPLSVDGVLGHGCVQDAPMTTEIALRAVLLTMMKKKKEDENFGGYSSY